MVRVFLVGLGLATTACVSTTTETRYVSDGERPVLVSPKADAPTLDAQVGYEAGVIKGHLTWSKRCRKGLETHSHDEVFEVKKPNRAGGVAAMLVGGLVGVASGAILANADNLSDEETCGYDANDNYRCSSPRQDATILGVVGIATGAGLGVVGLATLGMKTTRKPLEPIDRAPVLTKVTEQEMACGQGPVAGVGLALLRGTDRVAATSTNTEGDFALVVPARTTGPMSIIVDSTPWGTNVTRANELVARIDIPALPEPDTDPSAQTTEPAQLEDAQGAL